MKTKISLVAFFIKKKKKKELLEEPTGIFQLVLQLLL